MADTKDTKNDKPNQGDPTDKVEGVTTRDDALDAGVPMVPTSGVEPVGPEDALGAGPKRGDYTNRIGPDNYQPHTSELQADGTVKLVPQRPRAEDIGDTPGEKGGVTNADQASTD